MPDAAPTKFANGEFSTHSIGDIRASIAQRVKTCLHKLTVISKLISTRVHISEQDNAAGNVSRELTSITSVEISNLIKDHVFNDITMFVD